MRKLLKLVLIVSALIVSISTARGGDPIDEAWCDATTQSRLTTGGRFEFGGFGRVDHLRNIEGRSKSIFSYGFEAEAAMHFESSTHFDLDLGVRGRYEDMTGGFPLNRRDALLQLMARFNSDPDLSRYVGIKLAFLTGVGERKWLDTSLLWANTVDAELLIRFSTRSYGGFFIRSKSDLFLEDRGEVATFLTTPEVGYRQVGEGLLTELRVFAFAEGGGRSDSSAHKDVAEEHLSVGAGVMLRFHQFSIEGRGGKHLFWKTWRDSDVGAFVVRSDTKGEFGIINLRYEF